MTYRFGPYELDPHRFELRDHGVIVNAEPQVLAVLLYLVANRERMVSKDDLVEAVWQGRIVSDAAISSRIKSARQSVGDNGTAQRTIRTVHGRGFRFVAAVDETGVPSSIRTPEASDAAPDPERPSIAVLPFTLTSQGHAYAVVAQALPQEIIRELARLRWLLVIARSSSFRFGSAMPDVREIGRALNVRYVLHGTLTPDAGGLRLDLEIVDARDASIIWADHFQCDRDGIPSWHAEIVSRIVSALELRIPMHEAARARSSSPGTLAAWSAYHLGLQHMFCFNAADNAAAGRLFAQAIDKEPGFARAHAGLSFVRFQDAFLDYGEMSEARVAARRSAEQAVALDPLDPFANAAMGRAHWLSGDLDTGLRWLDRATTLSPNYAQAVYARAWTHTLQGHGAEGRRFADQAMTLSPLDPLHYAMLATRALAHLVEGEHDEAARWADRAAREPGAHALIAVIAAACRALQGDDDAARGWLDDARKRQPSLTSERFFRSFPFADTRARGDIDRALRNLGLEPR